MADRPAAEPTVMVDNDRVRVAKWAFAPGAATGWHAREFDYVVTRVIGSKVRILDGEGAEIEMVAGQSCFREAGVAHDVINAGPGEPVFVERELKEER